VDAFEQWARGGLAQTGIEVDDVDLQIMRFIDELFGPELQALMAADMGGLWPEADLDPSRAPAS
jgi:hypothetical protein